MSVEARTGQRHQRATPGSPPPGRPVSHLRTNSAATASFGPSPASVQTTLAPDVEATRAARSRPARRPVPRFKVSSPFASFAKRAIDLLVGIPLCSVMVLTYPWIAMAVKLTSRGPVLFRQVRIGQGGQPIVVYKFRSMHIDAEARLRADPELYAQYLANDFKLPESVDPRTTIVGRFLRRTSLDELPQAVCLVRGTMSAIGPRPIEPDQVAHLYGDSPECYLACKPGLTGLWQVSGRSHIVQDARARLDHEYALNWTLRRDIEILIRTVPAVLSAHGAH